MSGIMFIDSVDSIFIRNIVIEEFNPIEGVTLFTLPSKLVYNTRCIENTKVRF